MLECKVQSFTSEVKVAHLMKTFQLKEEEKEMNEKVLHSERQTDMIYFFKSVGKIFNKENEGTQNISLLSESENESSEYDIP